MRSSRRRDLRKLLREGRASSQRYIVQTLQAEGHEVTQATISRDLQELGALKVRTEDGFVYRLPDEMQHGGGDLMARNLRHTLEEFAVDVRLAGNLVDGDVPETEPEQPGDEGQPGEPQGHHDDPR